MVPFDEDRQGNCWDPVQEPLPAVPRVRRRISLCTVCMGRLHDLMVTLPVNIYYNQEYENLEFVVLNYNSPDRMDEWMRDYMMLYIRSGILVYLHTTEPEFYTMSHPRNVAFKMATGDIVANVDADNLIHRGFVEMLNGLAELQPAQAVFAVRHIDGQLAMYKDEWLELGGYDESLEGYGCEDVNLLWRAQAAGCKFMAWDHLLDQFWERMPTSDADRTRYMECQHLRLTWLLNRRSTQRNLERKQFVANQGRPWGRATLVKNFQETVEI
jgi:glycosyltransferase involved in cell wall biosynthesis